MARKAAARHGTARRGAAGSASEEETIVSNSDTIPGSRKPAPGIPERAIKSSPLGEHRVIQSTSFQFSGKSIYARFTTSAYSSMSASSSTLTDFQRASFPKTRLIARSA